MQKLRYLTLLLTFILLAGCSRPVVTQTPTQTPQPPTPPAPAVRALPALRGELFSGSGSCAVCHTSMKDEAQADVSTDNLWRGTMMANSARDPYWRSTVRIETLNHPEYQAVIEDKCATCHMPMARFTIHTKGQSAAVLDQGFTNPQHELHALAVDGVSCNLCHQIDPQNFGTAASYSGGYAIDTNAPMGERDAYGPYEVEPSHAVVMQGASGFVPLLGQHIEDAALCGTCHNLHTPYIDENGEIAGEFAEQMIYSEWLHSAYPAEGQTCQKCHMPLAEGGVQISITGGPLRSPFYQHYFVGGNAYMTNLLATVGDELEATAGKEHFETATSNAVDQLQNRTANLKLENVRLEGGRLFAEVVVQSQVGHKFPAGFPSRRAWLHVTVKDASGKTVFESGANTAAGLIEGNANDADPARFEPHYDEITSADQVQIYEAIMQNTQNQVTTVLLKGASYAKDNRLLPAGFAKGPAGSDIAVYGEAAADPDFEAGGDRVRYVIAVGEAGGPFTLVVDLLYQPIGFRWVENQRLHTAAEVAQFIGYYDALPNLPLRVATQQMEIKK